MVTPSLSIAALRTCGRSHRKKEVVAGIDRSRSTIVHVETGTSSGAAQSGTCVSQNYENNQERSASIAGVALNSTETKLTWNPGVPPTS